MSGPKDYLIRPTFSTQLFEGKLNTVFSLQSKLASLKIELDNCRISDDKLNIHIDCHRELLNLQDGINELTGTFVLDYNSPVGYDVYERINTAVDKRLLSLTNLIHKLEEFRTDFLNKKSDYDQYVSYINFFLNSTESFEQFKVSVISSLRSQLEDSAGGIFEKAKNDISQVRLNHISAPFVFGFTSSAGLERQKIIDLITQKENEIAEIRSNISNTVIDTFRDRVGKTYKVKNGTSWLSGKGRELLGQIKYLIQQCDEVSLRKLYDDNLMSLLESEALRKDYFFQELYNKIFKSEKCRRLGKLLVQMLNESSSFEWHKQLISERRIFEGLCTTYLSRVNILDEEFEFITNKFNELKTKNKQLINEDQVSAKENSFLKSQIIHNLEKLGYETVNDLEVIDFEKENDFLLKIKNQVNYLNLQFKEDGSMRYVFQVPEESDSLSIDQQNLKLHEMKLTCEDFKNVLDDLSKLGLNIELRNEKPIEAESLVSVTKRHKDKVKKVANRKVQDQKKNYLK